ncbi:MAG: PP2C family protein-serine/threonine phosphatase [Planctomycetota bacterium]|jgi:sigma-B regulation protein RsbU (phosphoserine phosphatase)
MYHPRLPFLGFVCFSCPVGIGRKGKEALIGQERRRTDRLRAIARQIQQKQEIESGLRSARKKQLHMLPDPPAIEGYEFGCYYNPASSLGGDFYDFVNAAEGLIGIVLGDVSGHGIDAAIVMGMAKKAINIFGLESTSPMDVLRKANESLYPDLDDMTFVSASYGVLGIASRKLTFVRAGHNPPILYSPGKDPEIRHLKPRGIVLGMQKGPVFDSFTEDLEVNLTPGDILLQYTDGIIEAKNKAGEEFGLHRLDDLIKEHGQSSAEVLVDAIRKSYEEFNQGQEQDDDITLVALKVLQNP